MGYLMNDEQNCILIYSAKSAVVVQDTTTETTLLTESITFPAHSLRAGDTIKLSLDGRLGTASSAPPTAAIRVKFDTTNLVSSTLTLPTNLNFNQTIARVTADICIRSIGSSGKAILEGMTVIKNTADISAGAHRVLLGTEVTIDTTQDLTFDVTYQFSAASTDNVLVAELADIILFSR